MEGDLSACPARKAAQKSMPQAEGERGGETGG